MSREFRGQLRSDEAWNRDPIVFPQGIPSYFNFRIGIYAWATDKNLFFRELCDGGKRSNISYTNH